MHLRRAGIGSLWALAGCLGTVVNSEGTTSTGGASWVSELQTASTEPAAYAIVNDEQGPYYAVVGIAGSDTGAATCSAMLGSASSQVPTGKWTLELAAPAAPGQYSVLSAQSDPIYPNLAKPGSVVRLVLLEAANSALQFYPVSGSVTIAPGAPSLSQEVLGQHLTGSYHLGFAAEPLQANCNNTGSATYDLGGQEVSSQYVCSCDTPEGKPVSMCNGGGGNFAGCCYQAAPASFTVDGTFDATACPGLCVAPLGIGKACHPLVPDGGG